MAKSNIILRPKFMANVSGGKDSLYMLYHILQNPEKYPLDMAVHFKLEIDYPFVSDVIGAMKKICDKAGIPFYEIQPRRSWQELYERYGFPSRIKRWCNDMYKLDCKAQIDSYVRSLNCRPVHYIGFCADEVKRFKYEIGKIQEGQQVIYPLAEDGLTEDKILEWARNEPLFNGFYKVNERQGCMYCPMMQYKEMAYIMIKYPEDSARFWEYIFKEWRERGFNCLRGDKYTPDYIYNRIKSYWVPKVEEILKQEEEIYR